MLQEEKSRDFPIPFLSSQPSQLLNADNWHSREKQVQCIPHIALFKASESSAIQPQTQILNLYCLDTQQRNGTNSDSSIFPVSCTPSSFDCLDCRLCPDGLFCLFIKEGMNLLENSWN
nr:PREDICTED: uncharacterized protein LOC100552119 [Anolis carolinensis]|eukprot:XP_008104340.1 PREDICTED: uncharacterized protein LOC100552119 [Anolis carolinensis]